MISSNGGCHHEKFGSKKVIWCFTPSQPLQLSQGVEKSGRSCLLKISFNLEKQICFSLTCQTGQKHFDEVHVKVYVSKRIIYIP